MGVIRCKSSPPRTCPPQLFRTIGLSAMLGLASCSGMSGTPPTPDDSNTPQKWNAAKGGSAKALDTTALPKWWQRFGDPVMSQVIGESSRVPAGGVYYYFSSGDFSATSPSQVFVFLDEHEDSINDGYFFIGSSATRPAGFNEQPASRHNRGANFVFADGHAERHRWTDKRTAVPITRTRILAIPQPNSADVAWIHDHSMIRK